MGTTPKPTERDQFWLDHEAALAASEQTAKAYAAEHDLSHHAFYQARKRLRALGLMRAAARRPEKKATSKAVAFSRVELRSARPSAAEFRLSLPNGFVLEWSSAELPAAVLDLVDRLTSSR